VSIGILADEWGITRRSYFYAGNVSEPGTLEAVVEDLGQARGGLLMDAGIATKENIELLVRKGIAYHCVVRQGFESYQTDYEQGHLFEHNTSNGYSYKIWLSVREHQFVVDGELRTDWLIFVKSEAKQAKEDGMLRQQKERFEKGLRQIDASLRLPKGHKSIPQVQQRIGALKARNQSIHAAFDLQLEDDGTNVSKIKWTYDPTVKEQSSGAYVIRTSEKVEDARTAWERYNTLTKVEELNRCCKTDLNIRPVYHQKDETIKAHLFLTLLACSIVSFIRLKLARAGIHWSWKEIVRMMNTQKVVFSKFSNQQDETFLLSNWSAPEEHARSIYDALQLPFMPHNGFFFKISPPRKAREDP
jgi:transposase